MKPLGHKAYGSIPHLPGSKRGPADKGLTEQQASLLTQKCRPGDTVIVEEKLDGSCVAIARQDGKILPLIRAGYLADSSPYAMHHHFAAWVRNNEKRFAAMLSEGERLCGEWLSEAHGTRYDFTSFGGSHEPFYAFDVIKDERRLTRKEIYSRSDLAYFVQWAPILWYGEAAFSVGEALEALNICGRTGCALDPVEGAVWRLERNGEVGFLGKFVRPDFPTGQYLNRGVKNTVGAQPSTLQILYESHTL